MALVARAARGGIGTYTRSRLARIRLRTRIAVAARAAVGLCGIRAHARRRVADAHVVAWVGCGTHDTRAEIAHTSTFARARVDRIWIHWVNGHRANGNIAAKVHYWRNGLPAIVCYPYAASRSTYKKSLTIARVKHDRAKSATHIAWA